MFERRCSDGETIYRADDPCDAVFRVRSGQVRLTIFDSAGRRISTLVDIDGIFGELRLMTGAARGGEARAVGDVRLDVIPREDVIREFDSNGGVIRPLLAGLFERSAYDAEGGPGEAGERAMAGMPRLVLRADGHALKGQMGAAGLTVAKLPFRVGRKPDRRSGELTDVDLCLADEKPFRLSRRHFSIEQGDRQLFVRDCGSFHGTIVNGMPLGGESPARSAPLADGENHVVAGGRDSPFRFILEVGRR